MSSWLFGISCILVIASIRGYLKEQPWSVWLLLVAALALRMGVAMLDPFLHDWDERFHALVAKNMIAHPFTPMLRVHPVLPYDYTSWCCNHIWVHKQPLFMWQMALSMKLFGVSEWAMRLPSALLSAGMVWCVYRIALIWTANFKIAYIAALLQVFAYYQLEMVSGKECLDHNDLVFTAYVTGGIWAFFEYSKRKSGRWILWTGLFVGCAILVKWLTALVVFGGWGLWILLDRAERQSWKNYRDLLAAFSISMLVALPWQWYITSVFPKESAWEYGYNYLHITEKLGAFSDADWRFHFLQWPLHYSRFLLVFFGMGLIGLFFSPWLKRKLTLPALAMAAVVYLFFSCVVQTKMPAFTYIVCALVLTVIALGVHAIIRFIAKISLNKRWMELPVLLAISWAALQPGALLQERHSSNQERNDKIYNTEIFKKLNRLVPADYLVFNCKSYEDVDLMFYQPYNAHSWCPSEAHMDSLLGAGHKIAVFQAHQGKKLPEYMARYWSNPNVLLIREALK